MPFLRKLRLCRKHMLFASAWRALIMRIWETELNACYAGSPRHPVFVALAGTVREFDIPKHEFSDLLRAFRQDQTVVRYESFDDLLAYCRYSANPVGHLVLFLGGYHDSGRQQLSDYTCTALQLANFWQDVSPDFQKGRIYLPLEDLDKFGVTEANIAGKQNTPQFMELMRFEVERAREWFDRGLPLGQEILNAIERQGYAVLGNRPAISKSRKLALVARAALHKLI
jgi:squalene synthase HpnC